LDPDAPHANIGRGFVTSGRTDRVSRAVDERLRELDSERTRREVAERLRWYVDLERQCRNLTGLRCAPIPPIRGLARNADLVDCIATTIERGACDPRITIRINRLLVTPTAPLRPCRPEPGAESDRMRAALLSVQHLIDHPGP
jgi:hypothetical protein